MIARLTLTTCLCLPQAAMAHVGHLADVAGHDHWIALGALGVAGVLAVLGARKGKAAKEADAAEDSEDPVEGEEAPA